MTVGKIVQFWHANPSSRIRAAMDTWRSAAAEGFEYCCYDDASANDFLGRRFDQRTVSAWRACALPAMRSDFFRICALLVEPGIYVDGDMRRAGRGLRAWLRRERSLPLLPLYTKLARGLLFRRDQRVANGFMIVKNAQDPLLRTMLEEATEAIERRSPNNVFKVTGPGVPTRLLNQHGADHDLFRGFEFWTVDQLRPYMQFAGASPHKRSTEHWSHVQKVRSIFSDTTLA